MARAGSLGTLPLSHAIFFGHTALNKSWAKGEAQGPEAHRQGISGEPALGTEILETKQTHPSLRDLNDGRRRSRATEITTDQNDLQ